MEPQHQTAEKLWHIISIIKETGFLTEFSSIEYKIQHKGTEFPFLSNDSMQLIELSTSPEDLQLFITEKVKGLRLQLVVKGYTEPRISHFIPLLFQVSKLWYYIYTGSFGDWQKVFRIEIVVLPEVIAMIDFDLTPQYRIATFSEKAQRVVAAIESLYGYIRRY